MPTLKSRLRADAEARPESAAAATVRSVLAEIDALEASGAWEVNDAQVAGLLGKAAADLRDTATICLHTGEEGRAAQLVAEAEALEACLPRLVSQSEAEAVVETVLDMLAAEGRAAAGFQPEAVVGMAAWILADRFSEDGLRGIVSKKLGQVARQANRSAAC